VGGTTYGNHPYARPSPRERVSPADNGTGWRMALDKLAAFVEADQSKQGVVRDEIDDA
jgi:hypothetical protein